MALRKRKKVKDTSATRARKNKKKSLMRVGAKNGAWKGGKSAHAYRRKAKAKPGPSPSVRRPGSPG